MVEAHLDLNEEPFNLDLQPSEELGDYDEEEVWAYIRDLVGRFEASSEGQRFLQEGGEIAWTENLIDWGFGYIGVSPATMSPSNLREILFEIIPRKASIDAEDAGTLIQEFRAFWQFILRKFKHPGAQKLLKVLDGDAEARLKRELADPTNFGMAKSLVSMGRQAGFDMSTQEGLDAWVAAYNRRQAPLFEDPRGSFATYLPGQTATKPPAAKLKEARRNKRKAEKAARKRTRK